MDGYQMGILYSLGCMMENRLCVRSIDRWYCDSVQPLFGTKVYRRAGKVEEKPQYVVKGVRVKPVRLGQVTDAVGFCRAYLEIHGSIDLRPAKDKRGNKIRRLRLRVFGKEEVLEFLMEHLPAGRKKPQLISNLVDGKYRGETFALYYQSKKEILDILDYIDGEPRNETVWKKWEELEV